MAKTNDFSYEIIEDFGTIAEKGGYELKLQKIAWNGRDAKYDIRPWKDDKCGKGATFTDEELKGLYDKLKELDEQGLFD